MFINKRVVHSTLIIPSAFANILYSCMVDMALKRKIASVPKVGKSSGSHIKRNGSSSIEREGAKPLFDRNTL